MNTHAFIFFLAGNGRWVMEAERVFEGDVSNAQALGDYWDSEVSAPSKFRVTLIPAASDADENWILR